MRRTLTFGPLAILALLAALALAAPWLAEYVFQSSAEAIDLDNITRAPSAAHPRYWLGTDEYGRSQVVRLLYGGQVSLGFALFVALMNLCIGVSLGSAAGYFRGKVDAALLWLITTVHAVPGIFVLLVVAAFLRPGPVALGLVFSLLSWTGAGRLVRGQFFALREREFVLSARALGASDMRIIARQVLPNIAPLLVVYAGRSIAGAVLSESALSYLGMGIQPPVPSWGNMLTNAQRYLFQAWWLVLAPGVAITTTVLCLYLLADALRDALDPRLRG